MPRGRADNPLQGLSLTGQLQPTLATAKVPVAAIDGPDQYGFWVPGVWGEVESRMLDAIGTLGGVSSSDPAFRSVANVTKQADRLRRQLVPFNGKGAITPAVAYPASDDSFPKQLQGLAAMVAAGLPLRCVALEATGEYDTHASQASALAPALTTTAASLLRVPARPRGARRRRPRADARLVRVRPAREGERLGRHRPRRGRHGVPDRLAGSGHAGRGVPGLATGLDADGNVKATSDFRAVYASLLEQWLGFDAARIIPGASKLTRAKLVK